MKLALCVFLSLVTFTLVTSLCTKDQWEGIQGSKTGYTVGTVKGLAEALSTVHFYNSKRYIAVETTAFNQGKAERTKQLIRYTTKESGKKYDLNYVTEKCVVTVVNAPFPGSCLPDGSKLVGEGSLGLLGGFPVSIYRAQIDNVTLDITVSHDGSYLVPISEGLNGNANGADFFSGISFMNITYGIANMSVFDIPKPCLEAEKSAVVGVHKRASVFGL